MPFTVPIAAVIAVVTVIVAPIFVTVIAVPIVMSVVVAAILVVEARGLPNILLDLSVCLIGIGPLLCHA